MGVRDFRFESVWDVPAPTSEVWAELERALHAGGAPVWWPAVRLEPGLLEPGAFEPGVLGPDVLRPDVLRRGARCGMRVRSPLGNVLGVVLTLERVVPGQSIAASSAGDLQGAGELTLEATAGGGTRIRWVWCVRTMRPAMSAVAGVLHPLFSALHARVMRDGERGLRAHLGGG